jgi:hypothetical protein
LLVAKGKGKHRSLGFGCPHTEDLLTPSRMWYGKTGDHTGSFRHRFFVWIPQGKTWTSPFIYAFSAGDVVRRVFEVSADARTGLKPGRCGRNGEEFRCGVEIGGIEIRMRVVWRQRDS